LKEQIIEKFYETLIRRRIIEKGKTDEKYSAHFFIGGYDLGLRTLMQNKGSTKGNNEERKKFRAHNIYNERLTFRLKRDRAFA